MLKSKKLLYLFVLTAFCILAYFYFSYGRYVNLATPAGALSSEESLIGRLHPPAGWQISFFAPPALGLQSPRQLAKGADNWLFAGSRSGKVYALRDADGDGVAEEIHIVAKGLSTPHGVAYSDGNLYIGAIDGIYLIADIAPGLANPPPPQKIIGGFYNNSSHGTRHIKIGPDGMLYVSLGTPCNICIPPDAEFTGVIRKYALAPPDAGEAVARGIRNSVGFDFHPQSGELWFTDNGRDWLGDELPSDELNRVSQPGQHFGYPYCHQGDLPDPEFGGDCASYEAPVLKTGPHVANLGMSFDAAGKHVYIALHGSWNRSSKIGYAVYRATLGKDKQSVTDYAPFVEGWLQNDGRVIGRPADVIFWGEDDMLISDDSTHAIYRVRRTL